MMEVGNKLSFFPGEVGSLNDDSSGSKLVLRQHSEKSISKAAEKCASTDFRMTYTYRSFTGKMMKT